MPATLPDSRILMLPIRSLGGSPDEAVASLLVNQASMDVVAELGAFLADKVRPFELDVIVGLPTLGLSLAPIVAQALGLSKQGRCLNYLPSSTAILLSRLLHYGHEICGVRPCCR